MDDGLRSIALASTCAAFVATPVLGALVGDGEQTARYDTVITPPDYAFAVWAPIFAGCVASTVGQCLPQGRRHPVSRRVGWPLAGAYAVNVAWSAAAQSDRFAYTPYLLPVAAGLAATAHLRLQRTPATTRWTALTPLSTGLLLGWTALASTVNIAAATVASGTQPNAPRTVTASTVGLLATSAVAAAAVARSRQGRLPLALASGWGLLTTALSTNRPRRVRLAAAAGAAMVATAAAATQLR
ncbi:hypothetical protein O7631_11205 [Micromonospora sp. WMMD967]|uniref:hypothetical protein n=1 Tax=Micromonospora sp. WMMD967 TaxID=3016101 RepID=UPI0024166FF7|nr:hypothetical protein [Micromonospora sp. WMMD967]MDG4837081.1 hypothetical protein [Micromonospora sp. WMMD967]